jgi:glyoxylase-like metal-dependent hydrolase (beta-lactamase superfamily II)
MPEIAQGVYWLRLPLANAYMVGEAPGPWVLVDAGIAGQAGRIRRKAEERFGPDARPAAVMLTHGHFDHIGSLHELLEHWDVPVYAHRLELPYLTGRSAYPPPDPSAGGWMAELSRLFPRRPADFTGHVRELPEGEPFGMPEWEWVHTPGHAPGHVSFFRRRDRTLIAGDAFVTRAQDTLTGVVTNAPGLFRPPAYFPPDWHQARESILWLAALEPQTAATGHGQVLHGPNLGRDLRSLAEHLPVPEHGRYTHQPARMDETGVVYVPPPVPDPRARIALGAAGVALAALAGTALARGQRPSHDGRRAAE